VITAACISLTGSMGGILVRLEQPVERER
jgi:hypothetical protein